MPTVLRCNNCDTRHYTASRIEKDQESGSCSRCLGSLISMGFPGYQAINISPYSGTDKEKV